jgi:hypothetical protein
MTSTHSLTKRKVSILTAWQQVWFKMPLIFVLQEKYLLILFLCIVINTAGIKTTNWIYFPKVQISNIHPIYRHQQECPYTVEFCTVTNNSTGDSKENMLYLSRTKPWSSHNFTDWAIPSHSTWMWVSLISASTEVLFPTLASFTYWENSFWYPLNGRPG